MKKTFVVMLFSLLGLVSYAQELELGVKLGANFSEFDKAKGMSMSNKTGFQMGGYLMMPLGNFALQTELLYSQQGAKLNRKDINLDYVNIPVLAKIYIMPKLNVHVGPQLGFVVKDGLDKIYSELKAETFDISGIAGLGLNVFGFNIEARYNFGLEKVVKNNSGIHAINPKNQMYSIAIGIPLL